MSHTIQILPPQLANQIAAGEVVERPASVVKELVENALDAGATKVEVDIERGGHKKITIKDNGKGVSKDQLALALSRHATSKISTMNDLEAIVSLGFRGEALASISSVSRLTLTSKPAAQAEAWSAIAEGLDMAVDIRPAAHPDGSTVEVLDLFFNTPARRKFLRAEKTEFSHIDVLIKRIAMSRPDINFTLKHNGKVIKRYRAQTQSDDKITNQSGRIAEVINQAFVDDCSVRTANYDAITISVWVRAPHTCKSVNPAQYAFVNGRMMRDKLLQHAIRQAYASEINSEQQPEYVLFIDLPATDVDVNVHPAKHEVRFHQARLLHDLLVGTIQEALADFSIAPASQLISSQEPLSQVPSGQEHEQYEKTPEHTVSNEYVVTDWQPRAEAPVERFPGLTPKQSTTDNFRSQYSNMNQNIERAVDLPHSQDLQTELKEQVSQKNKQLVSSAFKLVYFKAGYAVVVFNDKLWSVSGERLMASIDSGEQLQEETNKHFDLTPTPLLVPVRLKLTIEEIAKLDSCEAVLNDCGFDFKIHQSFLIIKQVPSVIRSRSTGVFLPTLFEKLLQLSGENIERSQVIYLLNNSQELSISTEQILGNLDILASQSKFAEKWQQCAVEIDPASLF
jgi:DNA mismatch repair protein MutL